MSFKSLLKFFISVLALILSDRLFGSVSFDSYTVVLVFALVLYLLNLFVRPVLILLTLPITVLTLGIFLLIINAFIMMMAARLVDGIHIPGFWTVFWFASVYSLIKLVLEKILLDEPDIEIKIERY